MENDKIIVPEGTEDTIEIAQIVGENIPNESEISDRVLEGSECLSVVTISEDQVEVIPVGQGELIEVESTGDVKTTESVEVFSSIIDVGGDERLVSEGVVEKVKEQKENAFDKVEVVASDVSGVKSEIKVKETGWNIKQFNLVHMAVFGVVILLLVIGTDLVRNNLRKDVDKAVSAVTTDINKQNDGEIQEDVPFLETPEVTGYTVDLKCGHELTLTKEQVQARLDRDLEVVQNALEMTEEEFKDRMAQLQTFEGYETSELTLFMKDSLEYYQFELYIDHLIEDYNVKPTQEDKDELVDSYLKAFKDLESEGYSIDELFMLEFGMDFDTWLVEELEIAAARNILVDHIPIDNLTLENEAVTGYNEIGDFARVKHILVDTQEEADRIRGLIADGAAIEEFEELSKDPGGVLYEFVKGEMDETFENWAFSSDVDDLGVVETQYGFHVIQSLGLTEGVTDLHRLRAQRLLADEIVYTGFMEIEWKSVN